MFALLDAYAERRRQELRDQGTVAAIAHHDPQGLEALDRSPDEPEEDAIADYRERRKERERHGQQPPRSAPGDPR